MGDKLVDFNSYFSQKTKDIPQMAIFSYESILNRSSYFLISSLASAAIVETSSRSSTPVFCGYKQSFECDSNWWKTPSQLQPRFLYLQGTGLQKREKAKTRISKIHSHYRNDLKGNGLCYVKCFKYKQYPNVLCLRGTPTRTIPMTLRYC